MAFILYSGIGTFARNMSTSINETVRYVVVKPAKHRNSRKGINNV